MRNLRLIAGSGVLLIALTSCVGPTYNGVLWRQIAAYKDSLTNNLATIEDQTVAEFAENLRQGDEPIKAQYWDGVSDPDGLGLASGGIIIWDLQPQSSSVVFSALIYSGPRDAAGDPLADPDTPYWGPESIYTCAVLESTVPSLEYADNLSIDQKNCPAALVSTLNDRAIFAPIDDFYG